MSRSSYGGDLASEGMPAGQYLTTPSASNVPRVSSLKGAGKASWTSGFRKVPNPHGGPYTLPWGSYQLCRPGSNATRRGLDVDE